MTWYLRDQKWKEDERIKDFRCKEIIDEKELLEIIECYLKSKDLTEDKVKQKHKNLFAVKRVVNQMEMLIEDAYSYYKSRSSVRRNLFLTPISGKHKTGTAIELIKRGEMMYIIEMYDHLACLSLKHG